MNILIIYNIKLEDKESLLIISFIAFKDERSNWEWECIRNKLSFIRDIKSKNWQSIYPKQNAKEPCHCY